MVELVLKNIANKLGVTYESLQGTHPDLFKSLNAQMDPVYKSLEMQMDKYLAIPANVPLPAFLSYPANNSNADLADLKRAFKEQQRTYLEVTLLNVTVQWI